MPPVPSALTTETASKLGLKQCAAVKTSPDEEIIVPLHNPSGRPLEVGITLTIGELDAVQFERPLIRPHGLESATSPELLPSASACD